MTKRKVHERLKPAQPSEPASSMSELSASEVSTSALSASDSSMSALSTPELSAPASPGSESAASEWSQPEAASAQASERELAAAAQELASGPESVTTSLKLFVVLSKAYRAVMDRAVKDMKARGLAPSEFMILEVLYNKGQIPLQQIGEKILVTSGSVTYNIDKLERKGLLKRVPCEEDRRVIYAEMTVAGRELFDRIFPGHAALVDSIMQGLDETEKRQAIELLKQLGRGAEDG